MKNVKSLQATLPFTSLPVATKHKVEHLFDCPLTFDEYEQMLDVCHEQASLFKTLFETIQLDEDVEQFFQVSNLAKIGEMMTGSWLREINTRRREFAVASTK